MKLAYRNGRGSMKAVLFRRAEVVAAEDGEIAPRDVKGGTMTTVFTMQDPRDHFAHCVQVFGGIPASSRRLGIDERAIRRFVNGDLAISSRLMEDTAKALRLLIAEAMTAEGSIAAAFGSEPNHL